PSCSSTCSSSERIPIPARLVPGWPKYFQSRKTLSRSTSPGWTLKTHHRERRERREYNELGLLRVLHSLCGEVLHAHSRHRRQHARADRPRSAHHHHFHWSDRHADRAGGSSPWAHCHATHFAPRTRFRDEPGRRSAEPGLDCAQLSDV